MILTHLLAFGFQTGAQEAALIESETSSAVGRPKRRAARKRRFELPNGMVVYATDERYALLAAQTDALPALDVPVATPEPAKQPRRVAPTPKRLEPLAPPERVEVDRSGEQALEQALRQDVVDFEAYRAERARLAEEVRLRQEALAAEALRQARLRRMREEDGLMLMLMAETDPVDRENEMLLIEMLKDAP